MRSLCILHLFFVIYDNGWHLCCRIPFYDISSALSLPFFACLYFDAYALACHGIFAQCMQISAFLFTLWYTYPLFWWNQYFLWRGYLQVIYTDPVVVHQYTCLSTDCSFLFRNTLCFFWPLHWSSFQLTFWHGKDFFIRANGFNRKKHNKIYE